MRTMSRRSGDPTTSPRSASLDDTYLSSPFLLCFHLVQGSRFSWRLRRLFLEDGILVSQPSPLGNAIKLSGRTFLAPHRGSCPKG